MAIKAKAEITISRIIDVENVIRYYLLQSSSIAAPSKPTANPPGGSWSTTEPTYNSGATNSLYFTDLTIMSNGTYSYSAVSKSSSYEAAKEAWNKANTAKSTADTAKSTADTARQEASDAAKTATNFMGFDSNGLVVGDHTANTLGKNVLIGNDSVNIRNGSTVLAEFAEKLIAIGKMRSDETIIDFLNGMFKISASGTDAGAQADLVGKNRLQLYAGGYDDLGFANDELSSYIDLSGMVAQMTTHNAGYVAVKNDKYSGGSYVFAEAYGQNNENTKLELFATRSNTNHEIDLDTGNGIYTKWRCNGSNVADITHYVKGSSGSTQIAQWNSRVRFLKNDNLMASYDGTTPVLLSTAVYPNADYTGIFSAPASTQPHGILIEFAPYADGQAKGYGLVTFFIPKGRCNGESYNIYIDPWCSKWIYVYDNKIVGNDANSKNGTTNGISYNNRKYVLSRVYGV